MTDVTGYGVRNVVRLRPGPALLREQDRAERVRSTLRRVRAVARVRVGHTRQPGDAGRRVVEVDQRRRADEFGVMPTNHSDAFLPLSLPRASVALGAGLAGDVSAALSVPVCERRGGVPRC